MPRRRHISRIAAMQTLYELERRNVDGAKSLERNIAEFEDCDKDFADKLLRGVLEQRENLVKSIEEFAPGWTFARMDPVSRCILLIGAYEILHAKDAPPAVVMDEAIEIAKEYGMAESGKFVNGVLNAMAKGMKHEA